MRVPLFITRQSLSSRSAIGVQTKQFAEANADWLHFHWWTSEFRQEDPRSILLENWLTSRYSIFKRGRFVRVTRNLGLSKWQAAALNPSLASTLKKRFNDRVSCAYVAPLDRDDAARCRSIVQALDRPFVLHVWDYLDGGPDCEEHRWLTLNAARVFCLSQPALDAVSKIRQDSQELMFFRPASSFKSAPPSGRHLIITLLGDVGSYRDGLVILNAALDILASQGVTTAIQYIGPSRNFAKIDSPIVRKTRMVGFLKSRGDVDEALAQSHVAFLSGPSKPPENDARSRYSIPSRTLDYLAIGCPVVGTVHPDSATGLFLKRYNVDSMALNNTPAEVAEAFKSLLSRQRWQSEAERCHAAFARILKDPSPSYLRAEMTTVGNAFGNA